nr:transporter substrate-binding domain-containing protein [Maliibacterium massiliense]
MKKFSKIIACMLLVVMAAAVLGACAPKQATPSASASASASAGSTGTPNIDKIKKAGKLVMLTEGSFPPFEYEDSKDGVNGISGVDVDIAKAVAEELGVELEVVNMKFDSLVAALTSGKGDLIAAGMTVDPERAESVDFTDDYGTFSQYIVVKKGNEGDYTKGAESLAGKVVGVQLGTSGDFFCSDETDAKEVKQYNTPMDAAMDVQKGSIDALVVDELPAKVIVEQNDDLVLIDNKLTEEQYAVAVNKGADDLLAVVNEVIAKMKKDGTIDQSLLDHSNKAKEG